MEHVRVCDAFGTGYFYIPGTETCLKFSGEVRMRVSGGNDTSTLDEFELDAEGYRNGADRVWVRWY